MGVTNSPQVTFGFVNPKEQDKFQYSLWNIFAGYKQKPLRKLDTLQSSKNIIINLNYDNHKNLTITAINGDSSLKQLKFKCKIKGKYLCIKKRVSFIPIPLLTVYNEELMLLSNAEEGNLIIQNKFFGWAWVLVYFKAGDNKSIHSFEKL